MTPFVTQSTTNFPSWYFLLVVLAFPPHSWWPCDFFSHQLWFLQTSLPGCFHSALGFNSEVVAITSDDTVWLSRCIHFSHSHSHPYACLPTPLLHAVVKTSALHHAPSSYQLLSGGRIECWQVGTWVQAAERLIAGSVLSLPLFRMPLACFQSCHPVNCQSDFLCMYHSSSFFLYAHSILYPSPLCSSSWASSPGSHPGDFNA